MFIQVLKSKIHCVKVTEANLDYVGSITIDQDLMDAANIMPGEHVYIADNNNGERFETYAIPAPRGSKTFSIRGAAAHLGNAGDLLVIMSFATVEASEAKNVLPRTITLAENNSKIIKSQNMLG